MNSQLGVTVHCIKVATPLAQAGLKVHQGVVYCGGLNNPKPDGPPTYHCNQCGWAVGPQTTIVEYQGTVMCSGCALKLELARQGLHPCPDAPSFEDPEEPPHLPCPHCEQYRGHREASQLVFDSYRFGEP